MPSLGNGWELSCNQLLPTPIPLVNDDDDDSNDDADAEEYGDYYGDDHADDDDNGNGDNDEKTGASQNSRPLTHVGNHLWFGTGRPGYNGGTTGGIQ